MEQPKKLDPATAAILAEILKAALIWWANEMRRRGLTEEQMQAAYAEARAEGLASDPSQIPDL